MNFENIVQIMGKMFFCNFNSQQFTNLIPNNGVYAICTGLVKYSD
jgi:hypothetical protein